MGGRQPSAARLTPRPARTSPRIVRARPASTFDPASVKLRIDLVVDGLETPVYVTDDGSGAACLYVVERGGVVRVVEADGFVRPKPFLDISALVTEGTEQGLHAIAFHPDFADNGRFVAHYNDMQGRTQIAEFRGTPCRTASNKPVKSLLLEEQPSQQQRGLIGFGPDGYLYIPLGDGGGRSREIPTASARPPRRDSPRYCASTSTCAVTSSTPSPRTTPTRRSARASRRRRGHGLA
jgi:glucose/arabinose dehydrogenase